MEGSLVVLFASDLGSRDLEKARYEERMVDEIGLDDVLPSNGNRKDLDYITREFDRLVIGMVHVQAQHELVNCTAPCKSVFTWHDTLAKQVS